VPPAPGDLPRVLVVGGPPFNSRVGAGVTLTGLFGGWPRERLADLFEDDLEPEHTICDRFYSLRPPGLRGSRVVRQLRLLAMLAMGRVDMTVYGGRPTRRLREWVDAFAPDIVFLELSSLAGLDIALALARERRVRLVVHVPDDWMPNWPGNVLRNPAYAPVTRLINRRLQRRLVDLFGATSMCLAISDSLGAALSARYRQPFRTAYNCVDPAEWPDVPPAPHEGPTRFVYSGSVFAYGQSDSLFEIAEAVAALAAEGVPALLEVYTQHHTDPAVRGRFPASPAVRLHDLVPRAALGDNLRAADVLLLPTNFDANSTQFLRYSMPGKMAEYLMSGRAVFAYGPPEVEQVSYLAARDCAELLTTHDPGALRDRIRRLATDEAHRLDLGRRARAAGLRDFDLNAMRARFEGWMRELAPQARA